MRKTSSKPVAPLSEVVSERIFTLPKELSNSFDPVIGKPCIFTQVNGKKYYIPVDTPTPIPYIAFCALKDIGILKYYKSYEKGELF